MRYKVCLFVQSDTQDMYINNSAKEEGPQNIFLSLSSKYPQWHRVAVDPDIQQLRDIVSRHRNFKFSISEPKDKTRRGITWSLSAIYSYL